MTHEFAPLTFTHRNPMRYFAVLACLALAACASTPLSSAGPESQTVRGGSSVAGNLQVISNTSEVVADLPQSVDKVWNVLPAAFDSLGIPVASVDPTLHTIGNEGFKLRQRLGKTPLSRFLDCGQTQVGPNADSYEVFLVVMVHAQAGAAPGTTKMTTMVDASARSIAFSQAPNRCSTNGELEKRLIAAVKAQLR